MGSFWGRKLYILKDNRNGKFDVDLGYSTKIKSYKCLNSITNKVVESENVKVDEYTKNNEIECKKEIEDCISFIYIDECEPNTLLELEKKDSKQQ